MPAILIKKTGEEPGAASLAVTVPVEQVQEAEARATSAYQRRARLPGFRKGKAPAALVKRQFADDIRQQTLEELIRESWKAALAQEAMRSRMPNLISWCSARGGRSRKWKSESWACCPVRRSTRPSGSRTTSPRRRSGDSRATSASRCTK